MKERGGIYNGKKKETNQHRLIERIRDRQL
jgi:hypothetical protein